VSESSGRGRLMQLVPLAVTIVLQAAIVGELVLAVRGIGHTDHTLSAVAAYQGSTDTPGGKLQRLDELHGQLTSANTQLSAVNTDRLPGLDDHIVQVLQVLVRLEGQLHTVAGELTPGGQVAGDLHRTEAGLSRLEDDVAAMLATVRVLQGEAAPLGTMATDVHRVGMSMTELEAQLVVLVGITRDLGAHVASIDRKLPGIPLP
jgi:hypothetical protein